MANTSLLKKISSFSADLVTMIKENYKGHLETSIKYEFFKKNPIGKTYMKLICLIYAITDLPSNLISKAIENINMHWGIKLAINLITNILLYPLKVIVRLFDIEMYISILDTIFSMVWNCIAKPIGWVFKKIFSIFEYFIKSTKVAAEKKAQIARLKRLDILEEGVLSDIKDKFVSAIKKAFSWTLKKAIGLAKWISDFFIENVFLKILYPVAKCITKNNKFKFSSYLTVSSIRKLLSKYPALLAVKGVSGQYRNYLIMGKAYVTFITSHLGFMTYGLMLAAGINMIGRSVMLYRNFQKYSKQFGF